MPPQKRSGKKEEKGSRVNTENFLFLVREFAMFFGLSDFSQVLLEFPLIIRYNVLLCLYGTFAEK